MRKNLEDGVRWTNEEPALDPWKERSLKRQIGAECGKL